MMDNRIKDQRWPESWRAACLLAACLVGCSGESPPPPLPQTNVATGVGAILYDRYDWIGNDKLFAFQYDGGRYENQSWWNVGPDALPTIVEAGKPRRLKLPGLLLEAPQQVVASPKGDLILLTFRNRQNDSFAVIDAKGNVLRKWSLEPEYVADLDKRPAWRPSGSGFAVLSGIGERPLITLFPLQGFPQSISLHPASGQVFNRHLLGWIDNNRIILRSDSPDSSILETYRLENDGFVLENSVKIEEKERWFEPVLSPNGHWVLFRSGNEELSVVETTDGKRRVIFPKWPERGSFRWLPDGKVISFVEKGRLVQLPFKA